MVEGDLLVMIPARDLVLITGSRNVDGIAKFNQMAVEVIEQSPYRLTASWFVWKSDKLDVFGKVA